MPQEKVQFLQERESLAANFSALLVTLSFEDLSRHNIPLLEDLNQTIGQASKNSHFVIDYYRELNYDEQAFQKGPNERAVLSGGMIRSKNSFDEALQSVTRLVSGSAAGPELRQELSTVYQSWSEMATLGHSIPVLIPWGEINFYDFSLDPKSKPINLVQALDFFLQSRRYTRIHEKANQGDPEAIEEVEQILRDAMEQFPIYKKYLGILQDTVLGSALIAETASSGHQIDTDVKVSNDNRIHFHKARTKYTQVVNRMAQIKQTMREAIFDPHNPEYTLLTSTMMSYLQDENAWDLVIAELFPDAQTMTTVYREIEQSHGPDININFLHRLRKPIEQYITDHPKQKDLPQLGSPHETFRFCEEGKDSETDEAASWSALQHSLTALKKRQERYKVRDASLTYAFEIPETGGQVSAVLSLDKKNPQSKCQVTFTIEDSQSGKPVEVTCYFDIKKETIDWSLITNPMLPVYQNIRMALSHQVKTMIDTQYQDVQSPTPSQGAKIATEQQPQINPEVTINGSVYFSPNASFPSLSGADLQALRNAIQHAITGPIICRQNHNGQLIMTVKQGKTRYSVTLVESQGPAGSIFTIINVRK